MSRASSLSAARIRDAARVFAALGDETRLRLVVGLSQQGPGSITRQSARSAVTRQAVTKHLRVLAKAGLARSTRQGREVLWDLEPRRLAEANEYLAGISKDWDEALDRLKQFVEG